MYAALIGLGYPLGSLFSVFCAERFERRTLLVAATLAVAGSGVAFGLTASPLLAIAFGLASSTAGIMQSNFTHIYQTELFHTARRSIAIGLPYAASRLVATVLPFCALTVLSAVGAGPLYAGSAALLVAMAAAVRILGPRTNNRRGAVVRQ